VAHQPKIEMSRVTSETLLGEAAKASNFNNYNNPVVHTGVFIRPVH